MRGIFPKRTLNFIKGEEIKRETVCFSSLSHPSPSLHVPLELSNQAFSFDTVGIPSSKAATCKFLLLVFCYSHCYSMDWSRILPLFFLIDCCSSIALSLFFLLLLLYFAYIRIFYEQAGFYRAPLPLYIKHISYSH